MADVTAAVVGVVNPLTGYTLLGIGKVTSSGCRLTFNIRIS